MTTSVIRRLSLSVSRCCGLQSLLRSEGKGPTVLFYHGVEENIIDPEVQLLHMPLSVFEKQLAFLRRDREIISMDYLHECIVNGYGLESRQVVLTFDDGYKNNLTVVAPLMKGWNLPFTIFVSTRHISECLRFPTYYIRVAMVHSARSYVNLTSVQKSFDLTTHKKRLAAARTITEIAKRAPLEVVNRITTECIDQFEPDKWAELNAQFISDEPMSWDDVIRTTSMGANIGSHCHDHFILHSNQPEQEVHWQLKNSKAEVEKHIGQCKYLAYPNGTADDVSEVAYSAAKSAQFRMAFSTIAGDVAAHVDCFLMPRIFAVPEYEEFYYRQQRPEAAVSSHESRA